MALRLACVPYEGDDYLLVLDEADRPMPPPIVERLAMRRVPGPRPTRRIAFVAADESAPATRGGNPPLDVRSLWWTDPPLVLDCGGFHRTVGVVEALVLRDPSDPLPGTTGWHLYGLARLYHSALADLAWVALPRGLIGVCVEVTEDRITAVRLDYPARVCLSGARVMASWEEG